METLFFYKGDQKFECSKVYTFINLILKHKAKEVFVSSLIAPQELKKLVLLQSLKIEIFSDLNPLPKNFKAIKDINLERSKKKSYLESSVRIADETLNLLKDLKFISENLFVISYLEILSVVFKSRLEFTTSSKENQKPILSFELSSKSKVYIYKKTSHSLTEKNIAQVLKYLHWAKSFIHKHNIREEQKLKDRLIEECFHHLPHPVVIINSNYEIVNFNHRAKIKFNNIEMKKNCYSSMFKRKNTCPGCKLGQSFQINTLSKNTFYSVLYQEFPDLAPEVSSLTKTSKESQSLHVMTYVDITKSKDEESQFLKKSKTIDLGLLSSGVAHEIKNPLAGLLLHLDVLLMDPNIPPSKKELLEEIQMETLKIKDLIQNILSYTKGDSPSQELSPSFRRESFV